MNRFIKNLALGIIVGGTTGLFLAPRSGKATAKKLKDDLDEAQNVTTDLTHSLKNFRHSLSQLKDVSTEIVPEVVKDSKKMVRSFKFQTEPRLAEINKQVEKIQQNLEPFKNKTK